MIDLFFSLLLLLLSSILFSLYSLSLYPLHDNIKEQYGFEYVAFTLFVNHLVSEGRVDR